MKKSVILFAAMALLYAANINAQIIPDSLRVDWSHVGYEGAIPSPSQIINVKDFGAYGDSSHDDYNAVINAINSSSAFRVIYFPAGKYLIKSPLTIPASVVIRGDGPTSNLFFDLAQYKASTDCITINKNQKPNFTAINNGYYKSSTSINVASSSGFIVNGYAEIKENNGDWDTDKTTSYVGQIVKVTNINGNTINFTPALRIDYIDSLQPKIRPVTLIENVGLECFKITRLDPPTANYSGKNIDIEHANNCWITGVESEFCQTAHVVLTACTHITISGCYFHDAFTYDGGGQAYGVFMHGHTSDSKLENSIFERLRHAMILADGANGNVYAYNYSRDPKSTTEIPRDNIGDLSLHGHYAFANLFEGNIVQNLIADDYWGAEGPYNTFFRNREELYGIEIFDQYNYQVKTTKQNVVGNEITNTLKGNFTVQTTGNFAYDNNVKESIQPLGDDELDEQSYYLTSKPYFWNVSSAWPSIGGANATNSGTIPAKERYYSGECKTLCLKEPASKLSVTITADSIVCNGSASHITITASGGTPPYNGTGNFYKLAGKYSFVITDAFGYSDTEKIKIGEPTRVSASIKTIAAETCKQIGSIVISNVSGGKSPYYFSLNGNDFISDSSFNNLSAGAYFVLVKDSLGCVDSVNNIVVESTPTIIVTAKTINTSNCKNDGSITISKKGGQAPFTYSIDGINYISTNIFNNLSAGTYTAWVKGKAGCTDSLKNITVGSIAALKISVKKTNTSCKNISDGTITINGSGGLKPYVFSIDSINYSSNNVFTNLSAGNYTAWIKDANTCASFISTSIKNSSTNCTSVSNATSVDALNSKANEIKVSISPNPSSTDFVATLNNKSNSDIKIFVTDMYGRIVYNYAGLPNESYRFGNNFIAGVYTVTLVQNNILGKYKIVKQ
jgi:hypothetical protein